MNRFVRFIKIFLISILVCGFFMALIDYSRMNSGDVPIFNIRSYDSKTKIQTFRGLFYIAERKIWANENESLVDSSDMKYKILVFDLKVPRKFKNNESNLKIETKQASDCSGGAILYYADLDIKVYTYCLDDIKLLKDDKKKPLLDYLSKDNKIIDDIDYGLGYAGLYIDGSTMMFNSFDNDFTNEGLTMYRCHKTNINDVYIGPKDMDFQPDFCTYKDDDFKFIFEIVDESDKNEVALEKEIFYEDENNTYEFDSKKSDYIFIVKPKVRASEEVRYSLKDVLNNGWLTIDDLEKAGLKFNRVSKEEIKE